MSELIYRHEAIKIITSYNGVVDKSVAKRLLSQMPSAEPRKKGKWILVTDNRGQHFECDKCGEWRYHQGQNFCSHCGADMRGEQNDTD